MRCKLSLACLLAVLVTSCDPPDRIRILEVDQGNFVLSNYSFVYEHWLEPKIRKLYVQENLEKFVRQFRDDWQLQKAVCNWTNSQRAPGNPDPYPLSNGLDILADIRSGKTKGFCGQYAYLFADALKALGYFDVRYVELESKEHAFHFTTEVWSNHWQKWVVLDPFFNVFYTKNGGAPLSALELHHLSVAGRGKETQIDVIEKRSYQPPADESVGYYYSFAIGLRNDLAGLDSPVTVRDRLMSFLQFQDPTVAGWKSQLSYLSRSSRRQDFEYTRNQISIRCEKDPSRQALHCFFETHGTIPHFKTFL